ncbi:hypothetical protein [Calothrix sp. NIES-3974]|uniref:hypothetical protein n=1 Tax=Calothrix sp. NIES-3974 TaxID=2005462 RepID=UPI000B5FE0D8|nr:hypothetical protein [Calothrix sp. NIES-3974]BAZ03620.1 hypothetical protein NIES3974_02490 [Calothrix sp. NIES-3974]
MLDAIFNIGTIIISEFVRTATIEIVRYAIHEIHQRVSKWQNEHNYTNSNTRSYNKASKDVINELEIIDSEFVELERKVNFDGYSSRQDEERKEELELLRSEKFSEYQKLKSMEIADEQCVSPENFETSQLKSDKTHILQFHMGQVVLDKKCSCGRPMILQSKQRLDGSICQLNDFFWACTGFYNNPPVQCKNTQQFTTKDVGLLHRSNIFEFQVSSQDLSIIFNDTSIQKSIVSRIKYHIKEKDDDILCPIHNVPMILREKRNHSGVALDMFFLACPHFGCQQIVKLKSPAQLAAYLRRREGRGIL